ncbi:MAG: SRPBCC family protein, partial [Pseudomonadota bacterium]
MTDSFKVAAALMLTLTCGVTAAAEVLRVDVSRVDKRFSVTTEVLVDATMSEVFDVLTDFDALADLSGSIVESRVLETVSDTEWLVLTRVKGCAFLFCRTVRRTERVRGRYPCELSAELNDSPDVSLSTTNWRLSPSGDGTRLEFSTHVEPGFWVPGRIGARTIRRMVMDAVVDSMEAAEQRAAA